jgi:hypothetical protein
MKEDLQYSVIKKKIDGGLNDAVVDIVGQGNYFILQYAPSNAEVKIRINNNLNPQILLMANSGFEAINTKKLFISTNKDAVGEITIIQSKSSEHFRYIPPVAGKFDIGTVDSVKNVESVNILHTVKNIENILNGGGDNTLTFDKLIKDYKIVANSYDTISFSNDEIISINDYILRLEQEIDSEIEVINWDMFDAYLLKLRQ